MMKKITLLLCMISALYTEMWAQPTSISLPDLLTPSPKASMMGRFGNYPTNLYTGLVDITIPIHTIQVNDITIPVEFKYHASGLKYDDLPMEVGYGWTLIAGGTVSYSARATGYNPPYGTNKGTFIKNVYDITRNDKTGANINSDQLQLEYVINGTKSPSSTVDNYRDSEYDMYNFSFARYSGQYYDLYNGDGFSVPASTLQFTGGYRPTAKDENGNTYYFEINDQDGVQRNCTNYLTKIISANLADTINFVYRQINTLSAEVVKRPVITNTYIIKETTSQGGTTSTTFEQGGMAGISYKNFNTPFLTEINYKGGKIKFIYSPTSTRSLTQIQITNEYGSILRIINLSKTDHKYLTNVSFCGANGSSVYSYSFGYNGTKPETKAPIDYWGYYNGTSTSANLYVPAFTVPVSGYSNGYNIPGMNRNPNETQMQQGILNKIVYPTKGYTTFTYEGNRANNQLYGGCE